MNQKTKYTGVTYRDTKKGDRVFYITYRINGKLKMQKVGTKAEGITPIYCKKLRDKILVKNRLGEDAPIQQTRSKTLKEVSDEYFYQSQARSISKTKSLYSSHLSKFDNELITAIDEDFIDNLREKKLKEVSAKTQRPLSPKTVNNILAALSAVLRYARDKKYISSVPKITKVKKADRQRVRYLSVEEIKMLESAIENSGLPTKDRLLLFVKLSLSTGARIGSILTITGKDINRTSRTVEIKNHKTGGKYTGFLSSPVLELIPPLKPNERLIPLADAKPIQRPLQAILDKLFNEGLEPGDTENRAVIHTLRHTFASHLAINGTPIHTIMKLMDHSDIKMTLRYAKLAPDSGRNDVEDLYQ